MPKRSPNSRSDDLQFAAKRKKNNQNIFITYEDESMTKELKSKVSEDTDKWTNDDNKKKKL